jgi:small subunit ribosomal protein S15
VDQAVKAEIKNEFKRSEQDTGSTEVQVALLSSRIKDLTEHLKSHSKDHSSRRGLIMMVNKRRKLLTYLQKQDDARYKELISKLGLRK